MSVRDIIALLIVGTAVLLVAVLAIRAWEARPPEQERMEALVGAELSEPDSRPENWVGRLRHNLSLPIPNRMIVRTEGEEKTRSWVYSFEADSAYAPPPSSGFECSTEGDPGYSLVCETSMRDARGSWTYTVRHMPPSHWMEFVAVLRPE